MKKCKYKAGDYVYEPYLPNNPGKVLSVKHTANAIGFKFYEVEVKWLNGGTTKCEDFTLKDFNKLIADHRKKLNTHTSKLLALEKL